MGNLRGLAPDLERLWHVANGLVTFLVVTMLFAMIFKFLPDTQVAWRDVWVGALLMVRRASRTDPGGAAPTSAGDKHRKRRND